MQRWGFKRELMDCSGWDGRQRNESGEEACWGESRRGVGEMQPFQSSWLTKGLKVATDPHHRHHHHTHTFQSTILSLQNPLIITATKRHWCQMRQRQAMLLFFSSLSSLLFLLLPLFTSPASPLPSKCGKLLTGVNGTIAQGNNQQMEYAKWRRDSRQRMRETDRDGLRQIYKKNK